MLLEPVACPIDGMETGLMSGGTVLITDDGRGVALDLADRISSRGWRVSVIGGPESPIDWTSPAAVEAAVRNERRDGPITALVHLLPLRAARHPGTDPEAWAERMTRGQGTVPAGQGSRRRPRSGRRPRRRMSHRRDGNGWALRQHGADPEDLFAGQGAVAGLIKTLAREWSTVRSRVVDTDELAVDREQLAEQLLAELFHDGPWSEVGYWEVSASGCGRCPHRCRKATVVLFRTVAR